MVYYYILLILYALASFSKISMSKHEKDRKIVTIALLVPAFVLVAFRHISVGIDTNVYYYGYNLIGKNSSFFETLKNSDFEIGYHFLRYIFVQLGFSYYVFQFFISAFIFYSIYRMIRLYSDNIGLSCFAFLTMRMMIGCMNTVRMWIAIAILLYAVEYIRNRNLLKFLMIVIVASTFHTTALVFIIIYPITSPKFNVKYKAGIFLVAIILAWQSDKFFSWITNFLGIYTGYLDSVFFNSGPKIGVYLALLVDLFFFSLILIYRRSYFSDIGVSDSIVKKGSAVKALKNVPMEYIAYIAILLAIAIEIAGINTTIMARVNSYFTVFYIILIPKLINQIRNNKTRFAVKLIIMILLFLQFLVIMIYRPEWNGVNDYHFFWYVRTI